MSGIKYSQDKPKECRYCYFWKNNRVGCELGSDMCSNRKQIRIASDDKPVEIVRSTFMKLDSEHIRFVMDRFKENTTEVRNIKQYLLASIYNAPYTIDAHYDAQVRHDMATGRLGGRW